MDIQSLSDAELLRLRDTLPPDQPQDRAPLRITVRPGMQRPLSELSDSELLALRDQADDGAQSQVWDFAKSAGIGVAKGGIGFAGIPGDVQQLTRSGVGWVVAGKLGASPERIANAERISAKAGPMTSAEITKTIEGGTGDFYKPQTRAGRYAETIGEFAPFAAGGSGSVLGKLIKSAVLPGAASERAGEATQGTTLEPYARAGAAVATGGLGALLTRPRTAQQAIRREMPAGVDPQVITRAEGLIANARARGITLTWPEAIEQVAPGMGAGLLNVQRLVESSRDTRGQMAEFFGPRPGQIERAARNEFDVIAPPNAAPSTIGPAVGRGALRRRKLRACAARSIRRRNRSIARLKMCG